MSELYLTRARLRIEDSRIGALLPLLTRDNQPLKASHHRIWSLMSDDMERTRDFLFREAEDGVVFVLGDRAPDTSPLWEHETRTVPSFQNGDVLQFTLRASLAVRRKRVGKLSAKRDPILERLKPLSLDERRAQRQEIAQEEVTKWLANIGQGSGFDLGKVFVEGHEQMKVPRRGGDPIQFSVVDTVGTLTITDAAAFADRLRQGFGVSKAWGCGLMLCMRIDR